MGRTCLGLFLFAAGSVGACGPCGSPPAPPYAIDARGPQHFVQICEPGQRHCEGREVWHCLEDGSFEPLLSCEATSTCIQGQCLDNPVCTPGEKHCQDRNLLTCRSDGMAYDSQTCDPGSCIDATCTDPTETFCVPGSTVCEANAVASCKADGSGWVQTPIPCGDAICLDSACHDRICEPGLAHCQDDVALVCNAFGTAYLARVCGPSSMCLAGRCQVQLCSARRFCDSQQAITCNADLTQIIAREDCRPDSCVEGLCVHPGRDAGLLGDRVGADAPQLDSTSPTDRAALEGPVADHREQPDAVSGLDVSSSDLRNDGGTSFDCRVMPCLGFTFCSAETGQCELGCARDSQCPGSWCDLSQHACARVDGGVVRDASIYDGADGAGAYEPDGGGVLVPELCPPSEQVAPGCLASLDEGRAFLCDGLDNDCDGKVDEGCPCRLGEVQRCFRGPPGRHNVGACEDGLQTCVSRVSSVPQPPVWGPCVGGIEPRAEVCDQLDNDCNGCIDEIEGCSGMGSCPGPGDPRIPDGRPFSAYPLRGADFYPGEDAVSWRWRVTGTPCDRKFQDLRSSTATAENGQLSYMLYDSTLREAGVNFTLSGDYQVQLDVGLSGRTTFSCTWIVHVRAPGLRVELCWDATGPTADRFYGGPLDIDLHLGKYDVTRRWFDTGDCDYSTCTSRGDLHTRWGYASTPIENCTGPGARGSFSSNCPNPRLDIDNIWETTEYVPENINLDNPRNGDRFRVMVHHYDIENRPAKPLVNVYCGGELKGTYGAPPDLVEGFDRGGGREAGSMWRVVDVTTQANSQGVTTGCDLSPLVSPTGEGYYLTVDNSTF
ncbi:MAG: MopE-related protein [Pseudomonadota bacterium]